MNEPPDPVKGRGATAADDPRRAVTLVVSPEWAQALTRLQQMHHEGVIVFRLFEDERRIVRISAEVKDESTT